VHVNEFSSWKGESLFFNKVEDAVVKREIPSPCRDSNFDSVNNFSSGTENLKCSGGAEFVEK
jgi:hypothetical protein